jgi:aryl carrier-like protein
MIDPMNGTYIRDVLAENLEQLRKASQTLKSYPAIAAMGGPANGTLGRVALREQSLTIDLLAQLAKVFGLEAWQMLVPNLTVKADGTNHPIVSGLPGWPFPKVPQEMYDELDPDDKLVIQGMLLNSIDQIKKTRPKRKKIGAVE